MPLLQKLSLYSLSALGSCILSQIAQARLATSTPSLLPPTLSPSALFCTCTHAFPFHSFTTPPLRVRPNTIFHIILVTCWLNQVNLISRVRLFQTHTFFIVFLGFGCAITLFNCFLFLSLYCWEYCKCLSHPPPTYCPSTWIPPHPMPSPLIVCIHGLGM